MTTPAHSPAVPPARAGRLSVPVRSEGLRSLLAIVCLLGAGCAAVTAAWWLFTLVLISGEYRTPGALDRVAGVGSVGLAATAALFWLAFRRVRRDGVLPWPLPLLALAIAGAVWAWGRSLGVL